MNLSIYIAFLIILIIACLIAHNLFVTEEGFSIQEQVINTNNDGTFPPILDEYQNPVKSGYYLTPLGNDKWDNGVYKQYTLKPVPYGYEEVQETEEGPTKGIPLSIRPKTNVITFSKTAIGDTEAIVDAALYRELTFAEYSSLPSKPGANTSGDQPPEQGFFYIKKTAADGTSHYEIAKIPINHGIMTASNPKYTYLQYTGPYFNIPNYAYSDTNTGENESPPPDNETTGDKYYKIRLVTEYSDEIGTPKTIKYVFAKIPDGYELDSTDTTYTTLIPSKLKYDPTNTDQPYHGNVGIGQPGDNESGDNINNGVYYQFDQNGQLVEVNYKESNFAPVLYYMPGAYKFGSSNFVPNYEDSVYLSRQTREYTMLSGKKDKSLAGKVTNTELGGFCNANKYNSQSIEEKCNALDKGTCASTSCCVLLGGQKCVAGNKNGPTFTSNYGDYTLRNKDFYYYQGKCYGNCNK